LGAGTAAAPALTFSTDANSGVYSPSAGAVAVAAAGANRLTINSGGISVNGNVDLSGNITKSGIGLLRSEGSSLGLGLNSLLSIGGGGNTAVGSTALLSLTTGSANTGTGYHALRSATSGSLNTALGSGALERLTSGYGNVAVGFDALGQAIDGGNNTAVGEMAGYYTSGSQNVAVGSMALWSSTGGDGQGSIAVGYGALQAHPGSFHNTAVGWGAGVGLKAGYFNLMLGYFAGGKNTGGNYNVYLAYPGDSSQPTEGNTIRIGNEGSQTRAFITGIRGATTGSANAIPVVIDSNGQLGTASSSRRAKTGIREIGDTTNTVMALRPVRFRYKAHASDSPEQYGLVAEEVAEVAPDLVARNREGQVETVFYDKVNAMLLNEVQKQHRTIGALLERLAELESQVAELSAARK
jgi:hypothetical protein